MVYDPKCVTLIVEDCVKEYIDYLTYYYNTFFIDDMTSAEFWEIVKLKTMEAIS